MSEFIEQAAGSASQSGPAGGYLQVAIEHTLGDLALQASFALSAPWTILFGPSGAGKTSLLRVIGGLTRPERGRVVLHGRTLLEAPGGNWVPAARRGIGFVTQRPTLFPHMDVTANVTFGLCGSSRKDAEAQVAEVLALVHADHLAKRSPHDLSGGEKQRIALARALAPEPKLLLLDEPFSAFDADLKERVLQGLTMWLAQRNIPALYVSHDVAEAYQTKADVMVMDHGHIQAQGPAHVVLANRREQLLRQLGE